MQFINSTDNCAFIWSGRVDDAHAYALKKYTGVVNAAPTITGMPVPERAHVVAAEPVHTSEGFRAG